MALRLQTVAAKPETKPKTQAEYEDLFETKQNPHDDDESDDDDEEEEDEEFQPQSQEEDGSSSDEDDIEPEVSDEDEDTKAIVVKAKAKAAAKEKEKKKSTLPLPPTSSSSSLKPILLTNPESIKCDKNWCKTVIDADKKKEMYFVTSGPVFLHPKPFPSQMRTKDKTEEEIKKNKQQWTEWINLLHPDMIVCLEHIDPKTINDDIPKREYKFKIYDCKYNEREFKKEWLLAIVQKYPDYLQEAIACNNITSCQTTSLNEYSKNTSKKVTFYVQLLPEKLFDELTKKTTKSKKTSSSTTTKKERPKLSLTKQKTSDSGSASTKPKTDTYNQYSDYFKTRCALMADASRLNRQVQQDLTDLHYKITTIKDFASTREGLCFLYSFLLMDNEAYMNQMEATANIGRKEFKLCATPTTYKDIPAIVAPFIDFANPTPEEEQEKQQPQQQALAVVPESKPKSKTEKATTKKRKKEANDDDEQKDEEKKKKKKRKAPSSKTSDSSSQKTKKKPAAADSLQSDPVVTIDISDLDNLDEIY